MRLGWIGGVLCALLLVVPTAFAQDTVPPELSDAIAFDGNHIDLFFSEEVDSATAVDIANYSVSPIVNGQLIRGLEIDSVVIEESHISVRLTTVQPLSVYDWELAVVASAVEDTAGNALFSDTLNMRGVAAVGYANWGDSDNYIFKAHLQLPDGTPVTDYLLPIHNNGPDGDDYHNGISIDDIHLQILPDENGDIRVEGLPSTVGDNLAEDGHYDLAVWWHDIYEPYGWGFFVESDPDSTSRTFILYPIVEGTVIRGRFVDGLGDPIPFWGYSGDDIFQLGRGTGRDNVSVWSHPPNYVHPESNLYYNPLTGEFFAHGNLGGGDYTYNAFMPGPASDQVSDVPLTATAGDTSDIGDIVLTPVPWPTYLQPISMVSAEPIPTPDSGDEITLSWHPVEHDSVVSYMVGLWTDYDILETPNPDSIWTRIAPGNMHVAVPASDTSITLSDLNNHAGMTITSLTDIYIMANSSLPYGTPVFWGVYASKLEYNTLNVGNSATNFSGYPEGGLQQLVAPTPDAPTISYMAVSLTDVKVWLNQEQFVDPLMRIRSYLDGNLPGEFRTYDDTITVHPNVGDIRIEAYLTADKWTESDTSQILITAPARAPEPIVWRINADNYGAWYGLSIPEGEAEATIMYRYTGDVAQDLPFEVFTEPMRINYNGTALILEAFTTQEAVFNSDTLEWDLRYVTGISTEIALGIPEVYSLENAYPNPFNPSTTINIGLPEAAPLTVEVFDVLGRQVAMLANGEVHQAGFARLTFDGSRVASGIYFVRAMVPGKLEAVRKVVLMR